MSGEPTGVAVLGSTGSIGVQALDVIRAEPGRGVGSPWPTRRA